MAYAELGFRHILDPGGLDHVLFVIALACGYRMGNWRALAVVVTAFTLGHSLTLFLAVTGALMISPEVIEPLIAASIVVAGAHGIFVAPGSEKARWWLRPVLAGVFGLVHGAGFANYLRSMFVGDLAIPLLGFNVGLEAGQLVILVSCLSLFVAVDRLLARAPLRMGVPASRLRGIAASVSVTVVASIWTVERVL